MSSVAVSPSHPWTAADDPVRRAIRRRSIRALRDLYADFALPPQLDEDTLPALDQALALYRRQAAFLGSSGLREAAENIGLLAGEILVNRRGACWVIDGAGERLGLTAGGRGRGQVAEPVRWALERAAGSEATLSERVDTWLRQAA